MTLPGLPPDRPSGWSADGLHILALSRRYEKGFGTLLWLSCCDPTRNIPPKVVTKTKSAELELMNGSLSPNGKWIAVNAQFLLQRSKIAVLPSAGGALQDVTDFTSWNEKPRWSSDGRVVYFLSNRGGLMNIWGSRFDPEKGRTIGEPFPLTSFTGSEEQIPLDAGRELAVGGGRVAIAVNKPVGSVWMIEKLGR